MEARVNSYMTLEGVNVPSILGSYMVWRAVGQTPVLPPVERDENGVCKYCGGREEINTTEYGLVRCLCAIHKEAERLRISTAGLRVLIPSKSLDDLQPIGSPQDKLILSETKKEIGKWMANPQSAWVTLIGSVGTGKTHILAAIARSFGVWALYLTTGDLETLIFKSLHEETLEYVIDAIRRHPILLIDDLGSEHGADFVRANLRKIVDFRYMMWPEFPTVVATNLFEPALRSYDPRIADRILDANVVIRAELTGPSWRGDNHGG